MLQRAALGKHRSQAEKPSIAGDCDTVAGMAALISALSRLSTYASKRRGIALAEYLPRIAASPPLRRHRGFVNLEHLIGLYIAQCLADAARPPNIDQLDFLSLTRAKMYADVARRSVPDACGHVIHLIADPDDCSDTIAVAHCSSQPQDQKVWHPGLTFTRFQDDRRGRITTSIRPSVEVASHRDGRASPAGSPHRRLAKRPQTVLPPGSEHAIVLLVLSRLEGPSTVFTWEFAVKMSFRPSLSKSKAPMLHPL